MTAWLPQGSSWPAMVHAVVLREATRMVGVVPNAAYRHFADHDELLAAVCVASMHELAARMAAAVARVGGPDDDAASVPPAGGCAGWHCVLRVARDEPGLFAAAFAVPLQARLRRGERRAR